MIRRIIRRILKHLEGRRKWNRTRRWMRDCTEGRLAVSLYNGGSLRRWRV